MKNIQTKINSVISAFLREHPSPSVLSLEPKCALDKFNICGNGCVGAQRPASWMGCQKLGNIEECLLFHTGTENRREQKFICGSPLCGIIEYNITSEVPLLIFFVSYGEK